MAIRREQNRDGVTQHIALVIAEQGFGGSIEREDPPGLVENDDTVGCRVENGFKLMDTAVAKAEARFHFSQTLQTVALRQASYDNEFCIDTVPRDGAALQLDRHLLALAGRQCRATGRKRIGSEEARQTARGSKMLAVVVAGERQERRVCKNHMFVPVNKGRHGEPREERPAVYRRMIAALE